MRLSKNFAVGTKVQVNTANGWMNATITYREDRRNSTIILVKYDDFKTEQYVARDQGIRITEK